MEAFNYTVTVKRNINVDDRKTIMNLYQPILGTDATSIYFTLLEEKDVLGKLTSLVFNEKRLMTLLKLSNSKLMEGIHKLEGLKLLKRSYLKSKDLVNFQIQGPVVASDFFDNIVLNDMLKKALGDQDYEVVRYCYIDDDILDDGIIEDITVSFVEAFPEETNEVTLRDLDFANSEALDDDLIDFQSLELALIKNDLPAGILTKSVKKILLENMSFFDLDQSVLLNSLLSAYDYETRLLQPSLLKIYLKNEITKKTETMKISELDKVKIDFKAMEPEDYVESLTGNKTSFIVSRLIKELKTDYQLSTEIINCLINYSVLKNNGKIVERYVLKIADTLVKKSITNLEDVMEYLRNAHAYTTTPKDEELVLEDVTRFDQINNDLSFSDQQSSETIELPEPNKYFIL